MSRVYSQRHPERTVFYCVLFHHIDSFLKAYESRFEREYGYLRPIVEEVVERPPPPAQAQFSVAAEERLEYI